MPGATFIVPSSSIIELRAKDFVAEMVAGRRIQCPDSGPVPGCPPDDVTAFTEQFGLQFARLPEKFLLMEHIPFQKVTDCPSASEFGRSEALGVVLPVG